MPYDANDRNLPDILNDLRSVGMPRIRAVSGDDNSSGVSVSAGRELTYEDNGYVVDTMASLTLTFNVNTIQDGWSIVVNARSGTATVNVGSAGAAFHDASTSKTITAGNAAIISCDGTGFRIFRMTAS